MLGILQISDKNKYNCFFRDALQKFYKADMGCYWLMALQTSTEAVQLFTELPPLQQIKKKAVLVYKAKMDYNLEIDEKNMKQEICFMEMKKSVLENLSVICKEVFLPILSNPENQKEWSELVSKDLMDKFNNFLAQVYVTIGQVRGRTLLPLPPSDATSFESKSSKDKAHILESSIITWTRQIKNVLKQDPESALKSGNNPDPLTEIEFWKNKAENLNSIYKQLQK